MQHARPWVSWLDAGGNVSTRSSWFPGGGKCTELCRGIVVQKRGIGGKDSRPVKLSGKKCDLRVRKVPLRRLERLRCDTAPNGEGATCGCGRVARKASTSDSRTCEFVEGVWTDGQHPMHLPLFEGNRVHSKDANSYSRVKRNKYQAKKSVTKVSCRISSLRKA